MQVSIHRQLKKAALREQNKLLLEEIIKILWNGRQSCNTL